MRKALAKRENARCQFSGTFERLGIKPGWKGREEKTLLLSNVRDSAGNLVCDHLWLNFTVGFSKVWPSTGDTVVFDARVKPYVKGYFGWREDVYKPPAKDYKLSHPTKIRKIANPLTSP